MIQIARNDLGKETRDAIAVGELGSTSSVNQGDLVLALGSPSRLSGFGSLRPGDFHNKCEKYGGQ